MKDRMATDRPWLFRGIRLGEAAGLVTLIIGLAASRWLVAAAGAALIAAAYALHRRWFPEVSLEDGSLMGEGDGGN